jgi:hypothetical protein
MKTNFFLSLLIMLFAACEQNITLDLGSYEPKLVVYCVLEPDSLVTVYVTLSKPYLDETDATNQFQFVHDAEVIVSDGATSETLSESNMYTLDEYSGDSQLVYFYRGSLLADEGKYYSLTVHANGLHASSQATVPTRVNINHAYTEWEITDYYFFVDSALVLKGSFTDAPEVDDYYRLHLQYQYMDYLYELVYDTASGSLINVLVDSTWVEAEYASDILISDHNLNGQELSFREDLWLGLRNDSIPVTLRLQRLSTDYALFLETYYDQLWAEGDPFSEPVFIYSNIESGLGVMGAATPSLPWEIVVQ